MKLLIPAAVLALASGAAARVHFSIGHLRSSSCWLFYIWDDGYNGGGVTLSEQTCGGTSWHFDGTTDHITVDIQRSGDNFHVDYHTGHGSFGWSINCPGETCGGDFL